MVAVVRMCSGRIDGLTSYTAADDGSRATEEVGVWSSPAPATETAQVVLADPSPWTAERPLGDLAPGVEYHLYGWTRGNSTSARGATFELADLEDLAPDELRYFSETTSVTTPAPSRRRARRRARRRRLRARRLRRGSLT